MHNKRQEALNEYHRALKIEQESQDISIEVWEIANEYLNIARKELVKAEIRYPLIKEQTKENLKLYLRNRGLLE